MTLMFDKGSARTGLEDAIKAYKEENLPTMITKRTMKRWFNHYCLYGETIIETNIYRRRFRTRRFSTWVEQDSICLIEILNEHPEYYLDESYFS